MNTLPPDHVISNGHARPQVAPIRRPPVLQPCDLCEERHAPGEPCYLYTWKQMRGAVIQGFGLGLLNAGLLFLAAWLWWR